MPEPVDLKLCHACRTGIQADARSCPVCGAPQAASDAPAGGSRPPVDPFEAMGGIPFGAADGRSVLGAVARGFLGRNRGCLLTALLFVFGPPILVGALTHGALGALGGALLVVGALGVLLTGWLVWLLRGSSGGGRG